MLTFYLRFIHDFDSESWNCLFFPRFTHEKMPQISISRQNLSVENKLVIFFFDSGDSLFFSRLLGNFLEAAKDLRLACKIDYDDQAKEWLDEVTPNVSNIYHFIILFFEIVRNTVG